MGKLESKMDELLELMKHQRKHYGTAMENKD